MKAKGRFHPSRTSGMQKQMRAREINKLNAKKKKVGVEPIDMKKSDWSRRKS